MPNIITINNLSFSYGQNRILDNINLKIPQGSVYGYLGKNGAGKTTTINLLLKLLPLNSDTIFYYEDDILSLGKEYFKKIGPLTQPFSMYKHLTPKEQLKYLNYFYDVKSSNIDKVLEVVGLYEQRNKKIKVLSAGMKQRLAIAMSLLHDPDLLIFDEPTNGLDPNAIIEFRSLIKRLNQLGKTIFLSSHIMGELEKCCTHIGIINDGRLVLQEDMNALRREARSKVFVRPSNIDKAKSVLESSGIQDILVDNDVLNCDIQGDGDFARIISALCHNDIDVYDIKRQDFDLESFYLHLTK